MGTNEQSKIDNYYRPQYADYQNSKNISFLPAIVSTSTCMHGGFLRLLFLSLQAQWPTETEAHFTATGLPAQQNISASIRPRRAAFYQNLKSKVGLEAAKAAALRINLKYEETNPRLRTTTMATLKKKYDENGRSLFLLKIWWGKRQVGQTPPFSYTHDFETKKHAVPVTVTLR
jgi:hypothetical protein